MQTVTYNLKGTEESSHVFYRELSGFTDYILTSREFDAAFFVNNFIAFLRPRYKKISGYTEYLLDFISMGVLLNEHAEKVFASGRLGRKLAVNLYHLRNKYQKLKPFIDIVRGYVSNIFLAKKGSRKFLQKENDYEKFIEWLEATGEYNEEAARYRLWNDYFKTLSFAEFIGLLSQSRKMAINFKEKAKKNLGHYTLNVENYQLLELPKKTFREDYLFCGKNEVEYHLNMVGAEIINRCLKKDFLLSGEKVLLLPTCMSNPKEGYCKAALIENKMYCTGCTPDCNINVYRKKSMEKGVKVNLLPHSSSYSKYLQEYKGQNRTGIIGVACVLNLMNGGYQLEKLNIPSQCIFLEYCGCKKHWNKEGFPTNLNIDQLDVVLTEEYVKETVTA